MSAFCYYFSRHTQRRHEVRRYLDILNIKKIELFEHQHPVTSLSVAVIFVTLLSTAFWYLIFFGSVSVIVTSPNYLLGGMYMASLDDNFDVIKNYQSGALLTFNMAFLGAYLWSIQNLARRYSMNDLIPAAYYNVGVRMIFASILALVFYHLSYMVPDILAQLFTTNQVEQPPESLANNTSSHLFMPTIAFLIGLFPQRGLKWLTEKFSVFTQEKDPTVRDLPLEMIEGMTIYDRVRLQELGVDSCYDLEKVDYIPFIFKSPYTPRQLIDWILQAKLCVTFGEHVKDLREHGIHTILQLKEYTDEELKTLVKSTTLTEDTLTHARKHIANDKDLKRLAAAQHELSRYWNVEE